MRNMIAYCGLDCEKCDAYLATIHDDQALREKTAKLWAELNHAPILPEHINCEGCRVDGVKTVYCESLCDIRQCALKKDMTESPPRYLVFFKGRDADALTAAFKEFSAKKLTQEKKPSIRKLLSTLKEAAQGRNAERAKVKNKDREVSL